MPEFNSILNTYGGEWRLSKKNNHNGRAYLVSVIFDKQYVLCGWGE